MEFKEFVSGGSRLAAEDEWELFGRLEAGMLASELLGGRAGVRHDATEEELRALVEQGNRAAEQLWRAGLGMAVKVASNLAGFCGGPVEDLEQAGCVGLAEAMERFDRAKGVRFVTFAWVWVRRRVSEEALSSDAARPVWRRRTERAVDRQAIELAMILGREASDEELAASMGVDERWIRERRDPAGDVPVGIRPRSRWWTSIPASTGRRSGWPRRSPSCPASSAGSSRCGTAWTDASCPGTWAPRSWTSPSVW
ncbi:MAG: hypothetical protein L0K74_06460 [Acidipropionibacterium acidipropionici]|nr:hypothetical protein [Acidipropionibacterium acidipropionici]